MDARLDCAIVTGFLGSGKTTLLRGLLSDETFRDTAVIVNEFGEVGLDHELISFSSERTIVLPGGCICCSIREDIEISLRELFDAVDAGRIPPLRRILIETTGIAEPIPLLMTLAANPIAQSRLNKPKVVTTVDAVLGGETLRQYEQAASQVASADSIVITKVDLVKADDLTNLESELRAINPWAHLRRANLSDGPLANLFDLFKNHTTNADRLIMEVEKVEANIRRCERNAARSRNHGEHHRGVSTHSIVVREPLDWTAFGIWATMLLHRHGNKILRVKGLLDVDRLPGPTLFQCAQHLVHPPVHLEKWPTKDRRSRIVFIVRDLDPTLIERSLRAFQKALSRTRMAPSHIKNAGAGGVVAGRPVRRPTTPSWIRG